MRRTSHIASALVGLALVVAALAPARASAENAASLRIASGYFASAGFDAVSENNNLLQLELNFARSMWPLWRGQIWLEGSYAVGSKASEIFNGRFATSLLVQEFTVGGRYALPVYEWLVPQVRVGLGAAAGRLSLDPQGSGTGAVTGWAGGLAGHVLAGVELLLPRSRLSTRVTGGLVIEAGLAFSSSLGFSLAPDEDEDLQQIPLLQADLGSVSLTGFQFRIGGVVRF